MVSLVVGKLLVTTPFVKWVGGKSRLLPQLEGLLPERITNWVEPFCGGGGSLLGLGCVRAEACLAGDLNYSLINAFRAVRDAVEPLIVELEGLCRMGHYTQVYYQLREEYNSRPQSIHTLRADVRLAALFIFLNKTCFNGLYRVNKLGQWNVSCGNYEAPIIYEPDHLRAVSHALRSVGLAHVGWETMLEHCCPGDFVYLDPPYTPASASSSDVNYNAEGFCHRDHLQLRDACVRLTESGMRFMLSQADTPLTREMYACPGWSVSTVFVGRSISSKASTRGDVRELVVRNYTTA